MPELTTPTAPAEAPAETTPAKAEEHKSIARLEDFGKAVFEKAMQEGADKLGPPKDKKDDKDTAKPEGEKEDAPKDEKPEKPDKTKPEEGKDKDKPKPTTDEEEEVKVTPRRRKARQEPDVTKIASETAARTVAEMQALAAKPKAEPEKKADPLEKLPSEFRYKAEILGEMEKNHPRKYKGAQDQFVGFISKLTEYQTKWEKDNPGEEFDPNAAEHNAFYEKAGEPTYEDRDFDEAKFALATKDRENKEVEGLKAKQKELEAKLVAKELEPAIDSAAQGMTKELLKAIDEQYVDYAKDIEKLGKDDPVAGSIITDLKKGADPFVAEVVKLWESNGAVGFNEKNEVHSQIRTFVSEMESHLSKLPEDQRVFDGRDFVTIAEFERLPESQRGQFWSFLESRAVLNVYTAFVAGLAKRALDAERQKYEAWQKRFGGKTPAAPTKEQTAQEQKPAPKPENTRESAPPPAGGGRSLVDTSSKDRPLDSGDFAEVLARRFRGQ